MGELICYCFQYTIDDIKADFKKNGKSLIFEKISIEKKMGVIVPIKIPKGNDALEIFTVL